MDLTDDSMKGTPNRSQNVCKRDFWRIKSDRKQKPQPLKYNYKYGEMLVEKNILYLTPLLPIWKWAHVAYISNGGLLDFQKNY
jgi:GTP cyclohydrolase I